MTQVILLPRTQWSADRSSLSSTERARLEAITDPGARARFLAARACVREALAARLEVAAPDVPIQIAPDGRPYLAGHDLQFSITHSADWVAVALRDHGAVGLDIEAVDRAPPSQRLIGRYYSTAERRLDPILVWTAKEALIKARGLRVPEALRRVELQRREDDWTIEGEEWDGWTVTTSGGDGYWLSLAEGPTPS
jgi:4'-phosphopantetheinyl transferase